MGIYDERFQKGKPDCNFIRLFFRMYKKTMLTLKKMLL